MPTIKLQAKQRRHRRVRTIVQGTVTRPRLVVIASLKHTAVQIIDDSAQRTLVHATDAKETGTKSERASAVGKQIAEKAKKAGITTVVFDRGGKLYHGRVKALAESARAAGLEF